ncbi:hypothetical protein WG66_008833 [Moniliophthora roreri]|nr:hypothetical protein WG66_008833 [Moniliophthora roreri]
MTGLRWEDNREGKRNVFCDLASIIHQRSLELLKAIGYTALVRMIPRPADMKKGEVVGEVNEDWSYKLERHSCADNYEGIATKQRGNKENGALIRITFKNQNKNIYTHLLLWSQIVSPSHFFAQAITMSLAPIHIAVHSGTAGSNWYYPCWP